MASKKKDKGKKGSPKLPPPRDVKADDAPKIIELKGGKTPVQLLNEAVLLMEDDLRISKKAASDLAASLIAAVETELEEGRPVNLFGLVRIVPRFHTKGSREINKVFNDPSSGKEVKKYPAKTSLKAKLGTSLTGKKGIEAIPNAQKLGKLAEAQPKPKDKPKAKK